MTDTNFGSNITHWIGKVVNVKDDPYKSGRVRVRIVGRHDDIGNFPDDTLPWAMPLQPVTSAAIGRIGTSPLGLMPGSHVMGMYADADQQYPIIIGSFGKAGDADGGAVSDGAISVDYAKGGSMPSLSQSDDVLDYNSYGMLNADRPSVEKMYSAGLGPDPSTPNTKGSNITKDIKKKLHNPDAPTVASVDPKNKGNILDHVSQVDPQATSRVLKNAVDNLMPVRNIMQMTSPAGITNLLQGSMLGGFSGLASKMGLGPVMGLISGALVVGGLSSSHSSLLKGVAAGLLSSAAGNGGIPLPPLIPIATAITSGSARPLSSLIVSVAPALYTQQYYSASSDPYPGHIQWRGQNGDFLYTLRNGEPNYASAQEHITAHHSDMLSSGFSSIIGAGLTGAAAGVAIASVLDSTSTSIQNMGLSKVLGVGASIGGMLGLASSLLPGVGGNIQSFVGNLGQTVLSGGFADSMNDFTHKQSILAMKKKALNEAYKKTPEDEDLEALAAMGLFVASFLLANPGSSPPNIPITLSNGTIYNPAKVGNTTTTTITTFIANTIYNL